MVKVYESSYQYDYQWPAVTLAFFLRYPNPFSTHVIASDTIDRTVTSSPPAIHTTRLLLKRGKLPASISRLIPSVKESYILETSHIDLESMTMTTESRNLDHTSILSVVESQTYKAGTSGNELGTDVRTVVTFKSHFGENLPSMRRATTLTQTTANSEPAPAKASAWSLPWRRQAASPDEDVDTSSAAGKLIEWQGLRRFSARVASSREGMKVVLDRLREASRADRTGLVVNWTREEAEKFNGWRRVWEQQRAREDPKINT